MLGRQKGVRAYLMALVQGGPRSRLLTVGWPAAVVLDPADFARMAKSITKNLTNTILTTGNQWNNHGSALNSANT
jgi:hypothetical protein